MVSRPKRLVTNVALCNDHIVKIDVAHNRCEAQGCTQKTGAALSLLYHPSCLDHALRLRPLIMIPSSWGYVFTLSNYSKILVVNETAYAGMPTDI